MRARPYFLARWGISHFLRKQKTHDTQRQLAMCTCVPGLRPAPRLGGSERAGGCLGGMRRGNYRRLACGGRIFGMVRLQRLPPPFISHPLPCLNFLYLAGGRYVHPKKAEVARITDWKFRDVGSSGAILVFGDSTCAYCVDTKWETSWRDLRADFCALSGGERDVPFGCASGAKVTDFIRQAQDSAGYGVNFYDWVFVFGG